jgi:hypothetical protein
MATIATAALMGHDGDHEANTFPIPLALRGSLTAWSIGIWWRHCHAPAIFNRVTLIMIITESRR